jgi:hypothetical protein
MNVSQNRLKIDTKIKQLLEAFISVSRLGGPCSETFLGFPTLINPNEEVATEIESKVGSIYRRGEFDEITTMLEWKLRKLPHL